MSALRVAAFCDDNNTTASTLDTVGTEPSTPVEASSFNKLFIGKTSIAKVLIDN